MGLESKRRRRTLGDHLNAQWCSSKLRVRSILVFFLFVNNLPNDLEALMLLFAKNGNLPDTGYMSSQFFYYSKRLVEEMGHADQSCSVGNVFYLFAQCADPANKARRLIFMIRHAFIDL